MKCTHPRGKIAATKGVLAFVATMRLTCMRWFRCSLVIAAFGYCAMVATGAQFGATTDEEFLQGLRRRRFFDLAERYCQSRLQDPELSVSDRGTLTLERIRTFSEQAANLSRDERQPIWQRADETANTFLKDNPGHPLTLLVKTQRALTVLTQGELALLEAEIAAEPTDALNAGRETLRRAGKLFESLVVEINAAAADRRSDPSEPDKLTKDELTSLLNHVQYQQARAARIQALSYPDRSPDRIAGLTQSLEQLMASVRHLAATDPLRMKMQLEVVICQRLLRDDAALAELWETFDQPGTPTDLRLAARAEQVRWHLNGQRPREALRILSLGRDIAGVTAAEFDFAHLETYVQLWLNAADAKQTVDADQWREKAIQSVQQIEQIHGPYWGRRAELLLVRSGGTHGAGSTEILRRAADDLFLKGKLDEAQITYDKASQTASQADDPKTAFEMAYKAALIDHQRKRHPEAIQRFQDLALKQRAHPQAANAHLLAVVNAAQLWKIDSAQREQYQKLLAGHLATWPYSGTANAARLWLGGLHEREQSWRAAVEAYQAVANQSEQFRDAVGGAERCWSAWLAQRSANHEDMNYQDIEPIAREAASWFEACFTRPDHKLPEQWSDAQRDALLAAVRIRLMWTRDRDLEVEKRLIAAISGMPPAKAEWVTEAQSLLLVVLASQPDRAGEARQLLAQMRLPPAEQWLRVVRRMAAHSPTTETGRKEVAKLQLAALDRLQEGPGAVPEKLTAEFGLLRGQAMIASSDTVGAVQVFAELARKMPQDADVQAGFGEALLASSERSDWQRALDQWRLVAMRSQPRTKRWFTAKLAVARAQFQLGDKQGAAKLIQYLQATENLANSGLEREFLELLRQCQG